MKTRLIVAAIILISLSGCSKPKWEYSIQEIPDNSFTRAMDSLGGEGWEMVFARRASDGNTYNPTMSYEIIFKRRK